MHVGTAGIESTHHRMHAYRAAHTNAVVSGCDFNTLRRQQISHYPADPQMTHAVSVVTGSGDGEDEQSCQENGGNRQNEAEFALRYLLFDRILSRDLQAVLRQQVAQRVVRVRHARVGVDPAAKRRRPRLDLRRPAALDTPVWYDDKSQRERHQRQDQQNSCGDDQVVGESAADRENHGNDSDQCSRN